MSTHLQTWKKAVLTLAMALMTTAGAFAQLYWGTNQTLVGGQVINDNIILTANITITVASGTANINGIISSGSYNYGITKAGGGELSINSLSTYGGATTVNGGNIRLGDGIKNGNLIYTTGVSLASGTNLVFAPISDITFSRVISGAGSVIKWMDCKVILTATNTYQGQTYVGNGTLQVGNGTTGSINNTSNVVVTKDAGGVVKAAIRFEPGTPTTFSKVISGNGSMEYKSTSTSEVRLFLTGANTFTGALTIEQGLLSVGATTAGSIVCPVTVNNGAALYFIRSVGSNYTYSGVISGAGNVVIGSGNSSGEITLNGNNTYTGITTIYGGTLKLGANGSIEKSSSLNMDVTTAKFDVSGTSYKVIKGLNSAHASAEVIFGMGNFGIGTLSDSNDGSGTFAGKISGNGNFVKSGTGTLTLTGTSTYPGSTYIYSGVVVFSNSNSLGTGSIYLYTATLRWASGNTADISSRMKFYDNNHTFDVGANNVTFASMMGTTTGTITKAGTGKLTFAAAQTYTGATVVSAGTLQIGNGTSGSINNTSGVTIASGAILRFEPGADMTFSKVISGAGKVEYKGLLSKRLYFTGENSYTGTTTIEASSDFYIGNGGTTGKVAGDIIISTGGFLTFNRSNEYTYSGVISGGGVVYKYAGGGKTILTGVNTYTGQTHVDFGTLQIGNGTSGSINNTSGITIASGATLRFEPGATMTVSKVISGAGKVEIKGADVGNYTKNLYFTADNTYTGGTVIEKGVLLLGNEGTTGSVKGNITNNDRLYFSRSGAYTYDGVISGTGTYIAKTGNGTVTLNGANTFTGIVSILNGTLALGASGSIESTSVQISNSGVAAKLDISAGNKKIKGLSSAYAISEVALGTRILTIGTAGQSDGGGTFSGKLSGSGGGVTKTGTGTLKLNNSDNTASGVLTLSQGTLEFIKWSGNFTKNAGTTLETNGDVSVLGTLTLSGGDIYMNLTQSPPSKINVLGVASVSGTNTLNITSGPVTNQVLIQASSGLNSITPYTLNMPGYSATLNATGTQLQLTATVTDATPPVPGAGVNGTATDKAADLNWVAATDNQTPPENLRYYVYQSLSNNITTVANCEANGTLLNVNGTINITQYSVNDLTPQTTYYFNVVVADLANNKAAYTPKQLLTASTPAIVSVTIAPKTATLQPGDTKQFYATVVAVGGANESVTWSVTGNESALTTVSPAGLLTIGANETASTIKVRATSTFDTSVFDDATITIVIPQVVSVTISPKTATVQPDGTQQFTATVEVVSGADKSVTWSVMDNSSSSTTISATGLLTVGANEIAETILVKVTSVFDPTVSDVATVTIYTGTDPKVLSVTISPKNATVSPGATQQFDVTVNAVGDADESVTWNVMDNSSSSTTVSATGLLTVGTNEIAETILVKVTSVFDLTVFDIAIVTIDGDVGIGNDVETDNYPSVQVYPNPTSGELRVESGEWRVENVEIFDVFGRNVSRLISHIPHPFSIDISFLPSGIYFLRITTENGTVMRKVIKK